MKAAEEEKKDDEPEATEDEKEEIKAPGLTTEEKEESPKAELKADDPLPSIWSFDGEAKTEDEDRFDKPSFLRRLRRHKKDESDKKD